MEEDGFSAAAAAAAAVGATGCVSRPHPSHLNDCREGWSMFRGRDAEMEQSHSHGMAAKHTQCPRKHMCTSVNTKQFRTVASSASMQVVDSSMKV